MNEFPGINITSHGAHGQAGGSPSCPRWGPAWQKAPKCLNLVEPKNQTVLSKIKNLFPGACGLGGHLDKTQKCLGGV